MDEGFIESVRSGQLTPEQQLRHFEEEIFGCPLAIIEFGDGGDVALAERLNKKACSHVAALWVKGEARVLLSLQKSNAPRTGTEKDIDIIVQRIISRTHKAGHATSALLALEEVAKNLDEARGLQLQSVITPGGRALGNRMKESYGWTELWGSFYSRPAGFTAEDEKAEPESESDSESESLPEFESESEYEANIQAGIDALRREFCGRFTAEDEKAAATIQKSWARFRMWKNQANRVFKHS